MAHEDTWLEDASLAFATAEQLEAENSERNNLNRCLLRLAYDRPLNTAPTASQRAIDEVGYIDGWDALRNLGFNIVRKYGDAAAARICRPLEAHLVPVGADHEVDSACRIMNRVLDGVFDAVDFTRVATHAYRDLEVCDIGALKWSIDKRRGGLRCERLDPTTVVWPQEPTDDPMTIGTIDAVPRAVLRARFPPRYRNAIDDLTKYQPSHISGVDAANTRGSGDTVKVVDLWCRAVGDQKGRHVIACSPDLILEDESWEHEFLPIIVGNWMPDFRGLGGVSLARILAPYQFEINKLVRIAYRSLRAALPIIQYPEDDDAFRGLSDLEFQKMPYTTQPAQITPLSPVSANISEWIGILDTQAAAEAGIATSVASGQAPTNLTSGRSLREYVAIADARLAAQQKVWESLWLRSAKVVVALMQFAYKDKGVLARAPQSDWLEEIKLKSIKLHEDQYRIRFSLTSGLSQTTSGKLDDLETLQKLGLADAADVARKVDLPDVAALADRLNAPRDLAEAMIDLAINQGKFVMPSSMQGEELHQLVKLSAQRYQREYQRQLRGHEVPPKNMEALRLLYVHARARLEPPPTAPTLPETAAPAVDQLAVPPGPAPVEAVPPEVVPPVPMPPAPIAPPPAAPPPPV